MVPFCSASPFPPPFLDFLELLSGRSPIDNPTEPKRRFQSALPSPTFGPLRNVARNGTGLPPVPVATTYEQLLSGVNPPRAYRNRPARIEKSLRYYYNFYPYDFICTSSTTGSNNCWFERTSIREKTASGFAIHPLLCNHNKIVPTCQTEKGARSGQAKPTTTLLIFGQVPLREEYELPFSRKLTTLGRMRD